MILEFSYGILPLRFLHSWQIFLVQHRFSEHWGFPKGKAEIEEGPIETAVRELGEETGLQVLHFLQKSPFTEEYSYEKKGEKVRKKVEYYPALVEGKLSFSEEEIEQGGWFSFVEAKKRVTYQQSGRILKELEELLKNRKV